MPLTRRQVGEKAYIRLIEVILEHNVDGPINRGLLTTIIGRDIRDVLNLKSSQIDTLAYKHGDDEKLTSLATGYKNLITMVKSFYWYSESISNPNQIGVMLDVTNLKNTGWTSTVLTRHTKVPVRLKYRQHAYQHQHSQTVRIMFPDWPIHERH